MAGAVKQKDLTLINHQGVILSRASWDCLRPFLLATYSSYDSVVTPRRLASDTLLVIRNSAECPDFRHDRQIRQWI